MSWRRKIFRTQTVASVQSPSAITQPPSKRVSSARSKTRLLSNPDSSGCIETTVTTNLKKVMADE